MKVSETFARKERELGTTYPDIDMAEPEKSAKKKIYRENLKKLNEEFKQALLDEYGVSDNPKREKAYSLAWDLGHSSGFHEVEYWFSEFIELIK